MRSEYDVIIVGAGPAGLECSRQLKSSGLSILLIEKNEVIGPKVCAGNLSPLADIDPPESKTRTLSREIYVLGGRRYEISRRNVVIDRYALGQYQLSKIEDAQNLTVLTNTRVRAINDGSLTTTNGEFRYRFLVGAEGASSVVRRHLRLPSRFSAGIYYEIDRVTDDFTCYLDPRFKSGYIWEFPHPSHTNVGIYFRPEQLHARAARELLDQHLEQRGAPRSPGPSYSAPISYHYQGCIFGNTFLAGEAAGLALKNTGEGIPYALVSGREIARKILDSDYRMPELARLLRIKKREETTLRIFDMLSVVRKTLLRAFIRLRQRQA